LEGAGNEWKRFFFENTARRCKNNLADGAQKSLNTALVIAETTLVLYFRISKMNEKLHEHYGHFAVLQTSAVKLQIQFIIGTDYVIRRRRFASPESAQTVLLVLFIICFFSAVKVVLLVTPNSIN